MYSERGRHGRGHEDRADSASAMPALEAFAQIKVIGVGGGGSNAIDRMIQDEIRGVDFITVNTDAQALLRSSAQVRIRIGDRVTRGLGAGGVPTIGARAADESEEDIADALRGADMVFIAAGMGGGTGTGAAPKIAAIARNLGALTVGVVTKPFSFEGPRRSQAAEDGIAALREHVDTLITIPNDRLRAVADPRMTLTDAFKMADNVLRQGIAGITDLITIPGIINVDFADVKTIMANAGSALMAIGTGTGEQRAIEAARAAIESPLLDVQIDNAKGILWSITGGDDLTLHEVQDAAEIIQRSADEDAMIIFGTAMDPRMQSQVRVTVIATGFQARATGTTPFGRPVARPQRDIIGGARPSSERRIEDTLTAPMRDMRPLPATRDLPPAPPRTIAPPERPPLEGDDLPPFLRQRR